MYPIDYSSSILYPRFVLSLSNDLSSLAYQLFSEGKSPIQVAIKLGLKEPEGMSCIDSIGTWNNYTGFIRFMKRLKVISRHS